MVDLNVLVLAENLEIPLAQLMAVSLVPWLGHSLVDYLAGVETVEQLSACHLVPCSQKQKVAS